MATYSNLGIKLIGTGEESGTWGTSTNTNMELVDQAISGYISHALSDGDATLNITDGSSSTSRNKYINFTGTLTAHRTITLGPSDLEKTWYIKNATTGGFNLVFKQGSSGTTVTVPNGITAMIFSDGGGSTNGNIKNGIGTLLTNGLIPEADNTHDLGSATYEFRNLYIDGIAYLDQVDIDAGVIDGVDIGSNAAATNLTVDSVNINGNEIQATSNQLAFVTGGSAERVRIDSSGNIFYGGRTTTGATTNATAYLDTSTMYKSYQGTGTPHMTFLNGATTVGTITNNGTNAAYNTTSDYRKKNVIGDIEDACERVLDLRPLQYEFKDIISPTKQEGFLAHEVQEVVPQAVTGDKDAVDPVTDAPILQQLDHSKLVPLLTQALKDAIWKIDDLEEKVEQLQDAVSEI
tara:strand:- start:696 stop:1913 length:1218 start_codon:yes stop_codon:yes gene_type:complete